MPAIGQNITHYQGDSRLIIIGPVVDVDGEIVDLTNAQSVRWWMAKKVTSTGTDIFIMKQVGSGLILQQTSGQWTILVTLDPEDTEEIAPGTYYHECEIVDAAANVATVTIGKFVLKDTLIPPE